MFDLGDKDFTSRTVEVGPTADEFRVAVAFTENYFQTNSGKLPVPTDFTFLEGLGYGPKKILKLLQSKKFREALSRRGISWPKNYNPETAKAIAPLTSQQQFTVLVVTDPTRSDPLRKRLEAVGVSYTQYRNWMKNPQFANAVNTLAEDMLGDVMGSVHTSVAAKAMSGDISAARLLYELSGRHDPAKQQMLDMARIIGLVLESLTRHVTDSTILEKLGKDLDIILSGNTPQIEGPKPDFSFVAEIVDADVVTEEPVLVQNPAQENSDGTFESDIPERLEVVESKRDETTNTPKGFFDI